jgi:hydrogenase expression/formation protein HypE
LESDLVRLGHGSGGKMTASLIEKLFLPLLGNPILNELDDAALLELESNKLVITTDAYVVSPMVFPGGDIGSLAVHGTVNDLAVKGARPLFLTATFILEEGLPMADLAGIVSSMKDACKNSQIELVAADTKVVNRGAADKLFISTCGIGIQQMDPPPAINKIQVGDKIIINGDIGRHGIAVMASREGLELETEITSDSASLADIIASLENHRIHCMRDITRGGLAGVLNEATSASSVGITIEESEIPIHGQVKAVCELLGLDPLYVACEGRFVTFVHPQDSENVLSQMKKHEQGKQAAVIGEVTAQHPRKVVLRSLVGGQRIVDKLSGEQLPRIC